LLILPQTGTEGIVTGMGIGFHTGWKWEYNMKLMGTGVGTGITWFEWEGMGELNAFLLTSSLHNTRESLILVVYCLL